MKTIKHPLSLLLCIAAAVSVLIVSPSAADGLANFKRVNSYADMQFADVQTDDWFYENVKSAYEFGLMIGRSDDAFGTEDNITVAEAMTIAARLHSVYFTGAAELGTSTPWYAVYGEYCRANGIADPADFSMDSAATRAQFAVIVANAMPEESWERINEVEDNAIPDVKLTDACGEAIYKLYRAGILIGGDAKGSFAPDTNIRRSEVAAIVTRIADVSLRQSVKLVFQTTVPSAPTQPTVPTDPVIPTDPAAPTDPVIPTDPEPIESEGENILLPPASILG